MKLEDKWDVYGDSIAEATATFVELKAIIVNHIKTFVISKATSSITSEDYEITKVSVVIKKCQQP